MTADNYTYGKIDTDGRQPQTDALKIARDALERIASIKADDGDNFSAWPDHVIIRCEITVADLKAIRKALAALEQSNG